MWTLLCTSPAAADEPSDTIGVVPAEEVYVVAERRVDSVQEAIVGTLRDRGYLKVLDLGEKTWFVNKRLWKPWLMVHDEGFARIRTLPVIPIGPGRRLDTGDFPGVQYGKEYDPFADGPSLQAHFTTTSPRARKSDRAKMAGVLEPYFRELHDARWELAVASRSVELRAEVVGIWVDGLAADGRSLPSTAERRAALVERWLATTPGESGEWARAQLEVYVDDVVQASDAPFTADEIASANERSPFDRPFAPLER